MRPVPTVPVWKEGGPGCFPSLIKEEEQEEDDKEKNDNDDDE